MELRGHCHRGSCFRHCLFSLIMIGWRPAWSANGKLNPRKTAAYRVSRACHTPMVLNPSPLCAGRVWKLKFFQGKIDVTIGTASDGGNIVLQDDYVTMDISIVARVYLYFNPEMADRDLFIGYKSCLTFFRIPNLAPLIYIYTRSMKYRWIFHFKKSRCLYYCKI